MRVPILRNQGSRPRDRLQVEAGGVALARRCHPARGAAPLGDPLEVLREVLREPPATPL